MAMTLVASTVPGTDSLERARTYTRSMEFDFLSWTIDALGLKLGQVAIGTAGYLPEAQRSDKVLALFALIDQINQINARLNDIYSDPNIADPKTASASLRDQLTLLQAQRDQLEPVAEAVVQAQLSEIVAQAGLTLAGQALPPVLFHLTPPPDALIISPRNVIRQDQSISISPDINVDQMETLESHVDQALDVSSLVVGIGGIGLYPTMVEETTDINALAEVVAHEWVHNYLTLRPLGISYENTPELRTMNETVASIAGKELGKALVRKYYPDKLPPDPSPAFIAASQAQPASPPIFDANAALHLTRVTTDQLLEEGKVSEAESYLEQRRQFLWENGYRLRKLNQAYFAFYGAYADQPGGPAGSDPVGAAVRLLREKSSSLTEFINRIAWMWNYNQLQEAVGSR